MRRELIDHVTAAVLPTKGFDQRIDGLINKLLTSK